MKVGMDFGALLAYTEWQREQWKEWIKTSGEDLLRQSMGEHGDGRFQCVGETIRHIFSAECRYVERLSGKPISDLSGVPADDVEALFALGERSRAAARAWMEAMPEADWDGEVEFPLLEKLRVRATPRKVMTHVLLHEVRHWAQLATLLRVQGRKPAMQDFLFSPVLGGETIRL